MALVLSQASSYNSGSDLWVCPDGGHSTWYAKLDWCLNFRLARYELKPQVRISPQFEDVIEQCEIPTFAPPPSTATLVSSSENLPARWLVVVEFKDQDLKAWVKCIHQTWAQLGKPSLRVFLPLNIDYPTFESHWSELSKTVDYTVVLDQASV